jgi:hypothetical protein
LGVFELRVTVPSTPYALKWTKPASLELHLFHLAPGAEKPNWISADSQATLSNPGTYFLAQDIVPPSFKVSAIHSDSLTFHLEDNVSNPKVSVRFSRDTLWKAAFTPMNSQFKVGIPNFDAFDPVAFRLRAWDGSGDTAVFPIGGHNDYLAPLTVASRKTPEVLNLGREISPWDVIAFPFSPIQKLTWGQIKELNRDADLRAAIFT